MSESSRCSFCGEPVAVARHVVSGVDESWICDACIRFSSAMLQQAEGAAPLGVIPGDIDRQKSLLLRTNAATAPGPTKPAGVVPGIAREDATQLNAARPATPPPVARRAPDDATPSQPQPVPRPRTAGRIEMPPIDSGSAGAGFLVNLDGTILPGERAVVPLFDRSFLYGDSVYETIRAYGGVPFALDDHLDRLYESLRRLRITPGIERDTIEARIEGTLSAANVRDAYIRVIVTRGTGEFGLANALENQGPVYVLVKAYKPPPREWYERGMSVIIPVVRRIPRVSLDPAIKSGNYLNSILAMLEAKEAHADDAVLLGPQGFVTEATTSTVFAVIDGVVVTPPLSAGILDGITRRHLIEALRDARMPVAELNLTEADLKRATEIFLTSTLKEVVPVRSLDGAPTPVSAPGPLTRKCADLLSQRIKKLLA